MATELVDYTVYGWNW